jgi:AAA domain
VKLSDPDLEAAVRRAKSGGLGQRRKSKGDRVGHDADNESSWELGSFTAAQLQLMQFQPIAWIVRKIIPAEGVTLLSSKPKFGKSWLAYDLCIACTMDRFTLGTIKPAQGNVLYLALEDSKRRLQRRMAKLLPSFGVTWPEALTLKTEWRRLHEGGVDDIRAWHSDTKAEGGKPILVVIDVLAKVRKPVGNRPLYEADYAALADLTKLANELGVAIVVLHHTRKMAADDLMETVSGSYGVSGAADTILVMATKGSGTVLDIRGRDVESAELAIEFNKGTCRWRVLGNAAEVHVSEQRAKIIAALKEVDQPMTIAALIEATKMKRNPLEVLLGRISKEGEIQRVETGIYAHKDYVPPPNDPPGKGGGRKPHRSVASGDTQTDRETDAALVQGVETDQQNIGICPSVASVRENADADGRRASVSAQTDRTDGQTETETTYSSRKSDPYDLSGNLSLGNRQTDDWQFPAAVEKPVAADDDALDIPSFLRRVPRARAPDRAPALGPPGDSLDDLDP